MTLHGGCVCGAVRYEAEGLDGPIRHCHCNTCRRVHGAASASGAEVLRERFRWTKGAEKLGASDSSPRITSYNVCSARLLRTRLSAESACG